MRSSSLQTMLVGTGTASAILGIAYLQTQIKADSALLIACGLAVGLLAFLRTDIGLYLLIVSMLLSPELTIGSTTGATLGRGITLRVDDLLLVVVGFAWLVKAALRKDLSLMKGTPINRPALWYALACLVPTLVGIEAGRVGATTGLLFVLKYLQYFMVFWMTINQVTSEEQIRRYLALLFGVAVLVAGIAVVQIPSGLRVSAPFEGGHGEPNTLGGYLVFMMALLLGVFLVSAQHRLAAGIAWTVLFIPFLYTLSRSSYLAFIPMLAAVFLLTRKRVLLLSMVALLGASALFPGLIPAPVRTRVLYTFSQPAHTAQKTLLGHRLDTSTSARLDSFTAAVQAFQDKPTLGWGVTGWHFIDSQYFRTLVETGLLGLCAFMFLIYAVLRAAFRARKDLLSIENPLALGLVNGFIAGCVGLLFHGIGTNTFIIIRIMEPFWMVCALVLLLPELTRQRKAERDAPVLDADFVPSVWQTATR